MVFYLFLIICIQMIVQIKCYDTVILKLTKLELTEKKREKKRRWQRKRNCAKKQQENKKEQEEKKEQERSQNPDSLINEPFFLNIFK